MLLRHWVATPSAAPSLSNSNSGPYLFAHRRVNLSERHTALSPTTAGSTFPNTLTPQSYSSASDLLRDEFLVSADSGATWQLIPRGTGPQTGPLTVNAYDPAWPTVATADSQSLAYLALDFGEFLAGDSQTLTAYLVNQAGDIDSLSFRVLSPGGTPVRNLDGILEISVLGVIQPSGLGVLDNSQAETKIYNTEVLGSDRFELTLLQGEILKLEFQLVNYPLAGPSEDIDYSLAIIPNLPLAPVSDSNPVVEGRIIDTLNPSGLSQGWRQDNDGIWVFLTGGTRTIGNPNSGATIAQSWTDRLFKLLWDLYPTLEVQDSLGNPVTRGANATADYNANRRLVLPDFSNRVTAGVSTGNPLGSFAGTQNLTLTVANLPSHSHSLSTEGDHSHTGSASTAGSHTHTGSSGSAGAHNHAGSSVANAGSHNHSVNARSSSTGFGGQNFLGRVNTTGTDWNLDTSTTGDHTHTLTIASDGSHTHSITINSDGGHTHSITINSGGGHTHTVGNTGSGSAIDLRQPTVYTHKLISTGY